MMLRKVITGILLVLAVLCTLPLPHTAQAKQLQQPSTSGSAGVHDLVAEALSDEAAVERVANALAAAPTLRKLQGLRGWWKKLKERCGWLCKLHKKVKKIRNKLKKLWAAYKAAKDNEEVICISKTMTKEVSKSKSAEVHAKAMADAFEKACKKGSDVKVEDFRDVFKSEDAFAFSKTMAGAMVACRSFDEHAYKCVSITASAKAYAEATATAHAEAVANAVKSCGCLTEAVADSISNADLYIQLTVEAAATATADVCIEGEGWVKDFAWDKCTSKVYGKIFAQAVAEAVVQGECLDSSAVADVLAEVGAEVSAESTCGLTAEAAEFEP